MGDLGTHTVRITNKIECTTETSETACGFVVEFTGTITQQKFNSTQSNIGGWKNSELRAYVNETIYNALPKDLASVITETKVISGHDSTSGEADFETQDKLYLLSSHEVYENGSDNQISGDTAFTTSRQLDYYKKIGVTTTNYGGSVKYYNGSEIYWWLRTPASNNVSIFLSVINSGDWSGSTVTNSLGVSPVFRIV